MPAHSKVDQSLWFQQTVDRLLTESASRVRPEVILEPIPAPRRLAPYSFALSAQVMSGEEEIASGRWVLLHDPAGQEAWQGTFRIVTFTRATVEPDIGNDPLLSEVGWAWLREALTARNAAFTALNGTVTRTCSESFGDLTNSPPTTEVEIRASWTPTAEKFEMHVESWCELLCASAGLPPATSTAIAMPRRSAPAS